MYLENRKENKSKDFTVYEDILFNTQHSSDSPYIYYYLSRLENGDKYLKEGLNKFPDDPYINFNIKNHISSDSLGYLFKEILKKHPKHNLSLLNLLTNEEYKTIINSNDYNDIKELFGDSKKINELYLIVENYESGPNNSKFYDFNDTEKYGLTSELRINFLNNSISNIKSKFQKLQELESSCKNKYTRVRNLEQSRLGKFSKLVFYDTKVNYLGGCEYKVITHVNDKMLFQELDIQIIYTYDPVNDTFYTSNGKSLNIIKKTPSRYDVEDRLESFMDDNRLIHGSMGMSLYTSNSSNGTYVFYGSICYGSNQYSCEYISVYFITRDYGETWDVEVV